MAIGPVILNGVVSTSQDYSNIKQNEDNKAVFQQQSFQAQFEKQTDIRHTKVVQSEKMGKKERKFDAREKGDNEYTGDGGKNKKAANKNADGKVIVKGHASFDMKI